MQCWWWWWQGLYPNTCNSYLAEAGTENRITLTINSKYWKVTLLAPPVVLGLS